MQIEIDFEVYKALTALREIESDTYSDVLRRLLHLGPRTIPLRDIGRQIGYGAWFNNTFFPDGTKLRATYKGKTFTAEIREDRWIDADGTPRNSPSEAASEISGTNVNGWRFWHAQRPGEDTWHRLDELRS